MTPRPVHQTLASSLSPPSWTRCTTTRARWFADMGAGITVGVVAAAGHGLCHRQRASSPSGAVHGHHRGFLISLLGGTSVQIGGPAGAFIVIVYGIVEAPRRGGAADFTTCVGMLLFALGCSGWATWCALCR